MTETNNARRAGPSYWCIHADDNDLAAVHNSHTCALCQQIHELASYMRDPLNPKHAIASLRLTGVSEKTLEYELNIVRRCLRRAQILKEREVGYCPLQGQQHTLCNSAGLYGTGEGA
jgi:hypothetical protein